MSTCWWSNNIIIAWTRKLIEFYLLSSYRGHSIASQFPLDLKKKEKIIQAKEEISIQETQESRKKKNNFFIQKN